MDGMTSMSDQLAGRQGHVFSGIDVSGSGPVHMGDVNPTHVNLNIEYRAFDPATSTNGVLKIQIYTSCTDSDAIKETLLGK